MKSIRFLALAALGAILFTGCDKESDTPDMGSGTAVQFTTSISGQALPAQAANSPSSLTPKTRAAGTTWGGTDEIGVFMLTAGGTAMPNNIVDNGTATAADNVKYTNSANGFTTATPIYYPNNGTNVDFVAYYPWRAKPTSDTYIYKVSVADQTAPAAIDLLWSNNATGKSRSKTAVGLEFKHALSRVVLNITKGEGMSAVDFSTLAVAITGMPTTADFALADGSFSSLAGKTTDITPRTITAGTTYEAIVIPQVGGTGRSITFAVDGETYTYPLPNADDFAGGKNYPYTITVKKSGVTATRGAITDWTGTGSSEPVTPIQMPAMVLIPAGTFMMGSPTTEPNRGSNETQHEVTLTKDFYMSKYQITNAQYAAFLNAIKAGSNGEFTAADYPSGQYPDTELVRDCSQNNREPWGVKWDIDKWVVVDAAHANHPVIYVTWYGATEYARWIGGSLPTEAQWEYACRGDYQNKATEKNTLPFGIGSGRKLVLGMANYYVQYSYDLDGTPSGGYDVGDNTGYVGKTTAVGSYAPNNYGLYDMHGNVWEWCSDWYDDYSGTATDPTGSAAADSSYPHRVLRGGSWSSKYARFCRSAFRYSNIPDYADDYVGFRVVLAP